MSGNLSDKRRLISITAGNLRNQHLYISGHHDFFPQESYGAPNARDGTGREITLLVEGLRHEIRTDIATEASNRRPRNFFRKRAWLASFFNCHDLEEGDLVAIEKVDSFVYRVYPLQSRNRIEGASIEMYTRVASPKEANPTHLFSPSGRFVARPRGTVFQPDQALRQQVRRNGAVYTPTQFAHFLAAKVVRYFLGEFRRRRESLLSNAHKLRILDPACGNGELLYAVWKQLATVVQNQHFRFDPRIVLCGIDVDPRAAASARARLEELAAQAGFSRSTRPKVINTNALFPYSEYVSETGWNRVKKVFDAHEGFDIVIANPPWGADVSAYRQKLSAGGFRLFQRQFDTSDLFVEKALSLARPRGYLAFIVPDSLFRQEREPLRKLLLGESHIKFLGRFGEKIFDKVNRACAVFICRKGAPGRNAMVDCVRLTPESRKRIRAGTSTFVDEHRRLTHRVPQRRFLANPGRVFDIDVTTQEETVLNCFEKQRSTFGRYLVNNRGVELSKSGRIYRCSKCESWMPRPAKEGGKCPHCGYFFSRSLLQTALIISREKLDDCRPLLVGESIRRYVVRHSLWISTGYKGIKYKNPGIYRSPKLVIRKTGVGISAGIDYADAYTNQVVYIFHQRRDSTVEPPPLEFFLGVLNSRAMYYFLAKKTGEIEWRSHPYLTQRQIMSFPLPCPESLRQKSDVIDRIAGLLKPHTKSHQEPPPSVDAAVEKAVADIYGLTPKHYLTIYHTLESVEELLPIRVLKKIQISDIFA